MDTYPSEALSGVSAIAAGARHWLALKDGGVIGWGSNVYGESTVPSDALTGVTAIAAGTYFSLAIKSGGVIAWGKSAQGQLDLPSGLQSGVTAISVGASHCLAIKDGGVVTWGGVDGGSPLDVPVEGLSGVIAIAAGNGHSVALKSDGKVIAWGDNNNGQTDVPEAALSHVIAIGAGGGFSFALKDDGRLVGWGASGGGVLTVPQGATPIVEFSTTQGHTLAVRAAAWATIDQTEVYSGDAATGTVHLGSPAGVGGETVALSCDNVNVSVPAYAVVPEGETSVTFPVTTDVLLSPDVTVKISTSYIDTATVPATFTLKGAPTTLDFSMPSVVGGSTTVATIQITIGAASLAPTTFSLSSEDNALLSAPATISVAPGETTATVTLTHNVLSNALFKPVVITATYQGTVVARSLININAFRATVAFQPSTINAGQSTTGTVTLTAVPRESVAVSLPPSDGMVSMPGSVTVEANTKTASFSLATALSATAYNYQFIGSVSGNTFSKFLQVHSVPSVVVVSLASTMYGNSKILGTVKLSRAADAGGMVITLVASDGLTAPATVTVPAGLLSTTFDVVAADVTSSRSATVTVSSPVSQIVKNITVNPLTPISFNMSSATANPGSTFTGTVILTVAPVTDTLVYIASADPLVTVPASVTVYAGTTTATFNISAGFTLKAKNVTVKASKNGKAIAKSIKIVAAS